MWRSQVQCTSESVMRACYCVSTPLAASDVLTVVGTVALWARICNFQQQARVLCPLLAAVLTSVLQPYPILLPVRASHWQRQACCSFAKSSSGAAGMSPTGPCPACLKGKPRRSYSGYKHQLEDKMDNE